MGEINKKILIMMNVSDDLKERQVDAQKRFANLIEDFRDKIRKHGGKDMANWNVYRKNPNFDPIEPESVALYANYTDAQKEMRKYLAQGYCAWIMRETTCRHCIPATHCRCYDAYYKK